MVQILRCAQDDNEALPVILSAAKDLYVLLTFRIILEVCPATILYVITLSKVSGRIARLFFLCYNPFEGVKPVCYTLQEIREKTTPIAKRYGIQNLRLFGSYARGDAHEGSDVDLRIDRGNLSGLFSYYALVDELETALNCHVDVVLDGSRDAEFLAEIAREEVPLYVATR